MLYLYQSNRLETLFELWDAVLAARPLRSPFAAERVVTPSRGMGRWLNFRLAARRGIAAHLDYLLPASLVWRLAQEVLGEMPAVSPMSAEVLVWRLMDLLAQAEFAQAGHPVGAYLSAGDDYRRYELARRVADLFDQYLVYRPDWLAAWEDGRTLGLGEDEAWQAGLWRQLVAGSQAPHRAEWLQCLIDNVGLPLNRALLPERITLFGIASLPPVQLELLKALAGSIDVFCFALNPCSVPWGDIQSPKELARRQAEFDPEALHLAVGNPLLAAWGRQGRAFFDSLIALPELTDVSDEPVANHGNTLLATLQQDILTLTQRSLDNPYRLAADDDSLQIAVCHSALREVEVLYDRLLQLLERHADLRPDEIVVLTPDIESYAPLIEAVFAPQAGRPVIPFAIADRGRAAEEPLLATWLDLMDLPDNRFTVEAVMGWLDVPAIRRAAGLADDDLPYLARWIEAAGIRWGIDAAHRARCGVPATAANTWREGLARLLLGAALPDSLSACPLYAGCLPAGDAEGSRMDMLARFVAFMERLFGWAERLAAPHTPAQWVADALAMLDELTLADEADTPAWLREQYLSWLQHTELAGLNGEVARAVLNGWLASVIDTGGGSSGFLTGKVTFCTLVPMRSLPFRVIAVLGLNDGVFPRVQRPDGFDLMARNPRYGDRSRRADDRYLMLETLLSARDYWYLSYQGRDARDNSERSPSVLIADLLDAIKEGVVPDSASPAPQEAAAQLVWRQAQAAAVLAQLVVEHPLQPFDARYFQGAARLPAYSPVWLGVANGEQRGSQERPPAWLTQPLAEDEPMPALAFPELLAILRHPSRALLRGRLGLELPPALEPWACDEPFEVEFAAGQQLRSRLARLWTAGETARAAELARASGLLPHGAWGDALLAQELAGMDQVFSALAGFAEPTAWDWQGEVAGLRLTGRFERMTDRHLLLPIWGRVWDSHWLEAWLSHAVASLWWPGFQGTEIIAPAQQEHWSPLPAGEARALLQLAVALAQEARCQRLPFAYKSARAFAESMAKRGDEDAACTAARQVWDGGDFARAECDDWHQLLWRDTSPIDEPRFRKLAQAFWSGYPKLKSSAAGDEA